MPLPQGCTALCAPGRMKERFTGQFFHGWNRSRAASQGCAYFAHRRSRACPLTRRYTDHSQNWPSTLWGCFLPPAWNHFGVGWGVYLLAVAFAFPGGPRYKRAAPEARGEAVRGREVGKGEGEAVLPSPEGPKRTRLGTCSAAHQASEGGFSARMAAPRPNASDCV